MKRHFYILCALVCALAWPMISQAQKVVYLDMQYILRNLPQYETANEQLSMISKRWQKEVDALTAEAELSRFSSRPNSSASAKKRFFRSRMKHSNLSGNTSVRMVNSSRSARRSSNPFKTKYIKPYKISAARKNTM